jgi:beta-phosphoglucomutase family hydrolase
MDWQRYGAALFDLDGVVTPTAEVHMRAWSDMFNGFLAGYEGDGDTAPYTDADYFAHVDGKPRYDGVRDFLASRGISLPDGKPGDGPDEVTVCGLGNRKNDAFNVVLDRDGVQAFPGSVVLLDYLAGLALPLGVVSSSANAPHVLQAAGLLDRFEVIVDGMVAEERGLPGKPAADTFVFAAKALGVGPDGTVVLEDAVSGVRAGAAGGFALVVGVDRGAGHEALTEAGAGLVVSDLAELVPQRSGSDGPDGDDT